VLLPGLLFIDIHFFYVFPFLFYLFFSFLGNAVLQLHTRFHLVYVLLLYINLYSPTSGSKERNIQTYKYGKKSNKNSYCVLFCVLLDGVYLSRNKRITYLLTLNSKRVCV